MGIMDSFRGMKHAQEMKNKLKDSAKAGQTLDLSKQIEDVRKEKEQMAQIKAYQKEKAELEDMRRDINHPLLSKLGKNVKQMLKDHKAKSNANIDTPENPFMKKGKNPFR